MSLHVGFTGTRHFMTVAQIEAVTGQLIRLRDGPPDPEPIIMRHGLCTGADEQFHNICRQVFSPSRIWIVGHPGPDWPNGRFCARVQCDEVKPKAPYMARNRAIVDGSHIMLATPAESEPQPRGGTWATIRMSWVAKRVSYLSDVRVFGPDGSRLNHEAWNP